MQISTQKTIHIPLPKELYQVLQTEAERAKRPMTQLAREAIDQWLTARKQQELHRSVAEYAASCAGVTDLDEALESASIEHFWT